MKAKLRAAILAGMFVSSMACAADTGWYVGAGIGQSSTSGAGLTKSSDTVGQIFGGHRYNQNLAVEVNYVDLGQIAVAGASSTTTGLGLSALGSLPLQNNASLYGRLGMAIMETTWAANPGFVLLVPASQTKTGLVWGVGGQLGVAQNIAVRLSYDQYQIGNTGVTGTVGAWAVSGVFSF